MRHYSAILYYVFAANVAVVCTHNSRAARTNHKTRSSSLSAAQLDAWLRSAELGCGAEYRDVSVATDRGGCRLAGMRVGCMRDSTGWEKFCELQSRIFSGTVFALKT